MRHIILTIVFTLITSDILASEDKGVNPYRVWANTMLVADWAQTREIAVNDDYYEAANLLLGKYPSTREVNQYFIAAILTTNIIGEALPVKYRDIWYGGIALIEVNYVLNNYNIGIKMRW